MADGGFFLTPIVADGGIEPQGLAYETSKRPPLVIRNKAPTPRLEQGQTVLEAVVLPLHYVEVLWVLVVTLHPCDFPSVWTQELYRLPTGTEPNMFEVGEGLEPSRSSCCHRSAS